MQQPGGPPETLSHQKQEQWSQELELIDRQENGKVVCDLMGISKSTLYLCQNIFICGLLEVFLVSISVPCKETCFNFIVTEDSLVGRRRASNNKEES